MKPTIGIVVCSIQDDRQFVTHSYIQTITKAGGIPILLPCISNRHRHDYLSTFCRICDEFLFCGGDDISPFLFGEEPLDASGCTDIRMDIFQISLMKYALQYDKPILAICRGMQVLNVAMGGTICQDLSLRESSSLAHMQHSLRRSDISHQVFCSNGSLAHELFGTSVYTNSFHHQCIKQLGEGLVSSAITSDQVIEAIESRYHTFVMGVQWHPECMYDSSVKMRSLFHYFIQRGNESPSRREADPSTPSF